MDKFLSYTSQVVPLQRKDVDTDQIIPAQYLTSVGREGYGQNLFRRLKDTDANFPLNLPQYRGAKILVTDSNFGCGSSREHAVWALQGAGFKAIVGKSFADIFSGNSAKNGLLLVELPAEVIEGIFSLAKAGACSLTIDLEKQEVSLPDGGAQSFRYDPFRKHCLLNGLDDIDYLLSKKKAIDEYRSKHEHTRFFSTVQGVSSV